MTYEEWATVQCLSPSSPEAYYAEAAWNAAVSEMYRLVVASSSAESTVAGVVTLLTSELENLTA